MSKILFFINKVVKRCIDDVLLIKYPFICKKFNKFNIMNIKDTVNTLVDTNKSLSRFGDGEIKWILGLKDDTSFEKTSKPLKNKLIHVLKNNNNNLLIGLPDSFRSRKQLVFKAANFWRRIMNSYGIKFLKYLKYDKVYANADVTRPYMDYKDKGGQTSSNVFKQLKKIWNNKKILIIEGEFSRLGVGNDLFTNASDIKRMECPPINAFESYDNIFHHIKCFMEKHREYLVLIALGPTATILAYNLSNCGFRAIDIGHLDLEYEWYLMGCHKKVNIPDRYVNEVKNGDNVVSINNNNYRDQIICHIK